MADVASKVAQIRQAVLGKDIRESMAQGIEAINTQVETITGNENSRVDAEASRVAAEENRVAAEEDRVDAESSRVIAENGRKSTEINRQTTFNENELNRQQSFEDNETIRDTTFNTNEDTRINTFNTNETNRQSEFDTNEDTRINTFNTNETDRKNTFDTNEANRETVFEQTKTEYDTNETTRQTEFNQIKADYNTASNFNVVTCKDWSFTATDTTNIFTIDMGIFNPVLDILQLSQDGALLDEDDNYTRVGAEITLTYNLEPGDRIDVVVFKGVINDPPTSDGSNLMDKSITKMKLSDDVVEKIDKVPGLETQLNDIMYDAKLIGLKGDGTDETTKLQNILSILPFGAILKFPKTSANYMFGSVTLPDGLTLTGDGIIKMIPSTQAPLFTLPSGKVKISELTFDYNGNNLVYSEGLVSLGENTANCIIEKCIFTGGGEIFISGKNHIIRNNKFDNAYIHAVGNTIDCIIDGNIINPPSNLNGISLECTDSTKNSHSNRISGNIIRNCMRIGIEIFTDGDFTEIINNSIHTVGNNANGMGISIANSDYCLISGNQILRDNLIPSSGGVYGIEIATSSYCRIIGNYMINYQYGIFLNGTSTNAMSIGDIVSDNIIDNPQFSGIWLFRFVEGINVRGNRVANSYTSSSGIGCERSDDGNYPRGCNISNNYILCGQSGVSTNLRGINLWGFVYGEIVGNIIKYLSSYDSLAIALSQCLDLVISCNTITGLGAGTGIGCNGGTNTSLTVKQNIIDGMKNGINLINDTNSTNLVGDNQCINCSGSPYQMGENFISTISHTGQKTAARNNSAPTSGNWNQGDKVFLNIPTASGYIGYVCVTSGTPGTWKGFGLIQS